MTALSKYLRLEAPGLWRPDHDAQRQNVIVSFGDATLTIADTRDRALAHWSLPAVTRLNPGETPALFAPSAAADEAEDLEIDDADMIAAIDKVQRAVERARPHRGRLRLVLTVGLLAALATGAVTWLPGALLTQTVNVLPEATREAVGARLLTRIRRVAGAPCTDRPGQTALDALGRRVIGTDATAHLVVLSSGVRLAGHLPGHIVLLNRALVEDYEEPDVVAGFLLAEHLRAERTDPMRALLDHAGSFATAKLLTTGEISDTTLDAYTEQLLIAPAPDLPDDALIDRFAAAKVRATPYAYALDQTGETTLGLIEADPVPLSEAVPLVDDATWIALQGICGE